MDQKVVILAGNYSSTNIVYHALKNDFNIVKVVREEKVPRVELVKRRIKKLGIVKVIGQILFMAMIVPVLEITSGRRRADIMGKYGLDDSPISPDLLKDVRSINSDEALVELKRLDPAAVVINGTRIISEKILNNCSAKFINMHAGITPAYRGSHGAYWALAKKDRENAGVTVHLVDKGIDTGAIIAQARITSEADDNFVTYPWLQTAAGLPLLKQAVRDALAGHLKTKPVSTGPSELYSHPTIWGYLWRRMRYGIK
ncbi:MAG: formyl transferase [Planctomycetes bacterium]|jgi:methionyl-tRNA formyltransferase|nr:formyl transferase [Planctomycetota bacterium]